MPLLHIAVWVLMPALSATNAQQSVDFQHVADLGNRLVQAAPTSIDDYTPQRVDEIKNGASELNRSVAIVCKYCVVNRPDYLFPALKFVSDIRQAVDTTLQRLTQQRLLFAQSTESSERELKVTLYLEIMTQFIDLCGRMNDHYAGFVRDAAYLADRFPDGLDQLEKHIQADASGIATSVLANVLITPLDTSTPETTRLGTNFRRILLVQMHQRGRHDVLPVLSEFFLNSDAHPQWKLVAAEAIRQIGLPQDPPPHLANIEGEIPSITAKQLLAELRELRPKLAIELRERCDTLITWTKERAEQGLVKPLLLFEKTPILPGDWVLVRNSSPYNNCTNLAPGLFTHVGVAALHTDKDGIRRLVVADVTERKRYIDGDNLDKDLRSAVHYAVLRHEDPEVGKKMGEIAQSLIGNEMQFDLTFDTSRVVVMKGLPLKGTKIVTYCAGLLLLCAQETGLAREEFFPIAEQPLGGNGIVNFQTMGLRFGRDFISPTGALFGEKMRVVAFGQPMFDPAIKIEQRVYDHFAQAMREQVLTPKSSVYQELRLQVAKLAKQQVLVREALAAAANVNPELDMVAAAKAAAVVETLDEIAHAASDQYNKAVFALTAGSEEQLRAEGISEEQQKEIRAFRDRHAKEWLQISSGERTPREVTDDLIEFYAQQGSREMDRRFFSQEPESTSELSTTNNTPVP